MILAVAVLSIVITAPLGAMGIKILGERILEADERPTYRFKDLRQGLGLPRVGERLRRKSDGSRWKVIEEKEAWSNGEGPDRPPVPVIHLRLWKVRGGEPPGSGATKTITSAPRGPGFLQEWEILND